MPQTPTGTFLDDPSHAQHAHAGIHPLEDRLYVVTPIFNPLRFLSRYKHYWAFAKRVEDAGAILYTVELAYGARKYEVTEPHNPRHIQLFTDTELWYKENLINIGVSRLPASWKYVAWVDADALFARPDWAQETLHQLQHHAAVQMFSHIQDLGPNHEPVHQILPSFGFTYQSRLKTLSRPDLAGFPFQGGYYGATSSAAVKGQWAQPGMAWAWRRDAWDAVGGMMDWPILGSGDWHMATALVGQVQRSLEGDNGERAAWHTEGYRELCYRWQALAERYVRRNIGYVPGMVQHFWHGKKAHRNYTTRGNILRATLFAPQTDLYKDSQGLWQLNPLNPAFTQLRDGIRAYFRMRNEDSIDA